MKAILKSIRPKHFADILSGRKTLEIDKKIPRCELPIDVYIYCTKGEPLYRHWRDGSVYQIADRDYARMCNPANLHNGKIVAKFTLREVEPLMSEDRENGTLEKACLSYEEAKKYQGKSLWLYAWHISDLHIFDKPMELGEFYKYEHNFIIKETPAHFDIGPLTRPPQSWQYVEVNQNENI